MLVTPGRLLMRGGGGMPSLDLDFLGGTLDPRITFTRASTATYFDSAGVLQTTNTPRFDYDPVTHAVRGLLIEEARTNLVAGDLTNTTNWPAVATTRASGAAAPDGSSNGVTFTQNASGTTSYGFNSVSSTVTASTPTTASLFVKAGTGSWLRFILSDAAVSTIAAQAWFNVSAGTVGTSGVFTSTGGTPTGISATISHVGNSWYRCTLTATLATATTAFALLRMTSADNVSSDAGSKTMSFFGPQLEVGAFATSLIPTTTAAVTRAADVATVDTLTPWFNASEGTLFVEALYGAPTSANLVLASLDTDALNRMTLQNASGAGRFYVRTAGADQAVIGTGTITQGAVVKLAGAYKANDCAGSTNGSAAGTDTSVTLPAVTTLWIGRYTSAVNSPLNGHVRRIKYWTARKTAADLQSLTS